MKKEKLSKKDTEKVSGGYRVEYDDPKFGRFKDADGKTFDRFCDTCGKEITGRGAIFFPEIPGREFCLDCALKVQQFVKNLGPDGKLGVSDDITFNNPK